MPSTVEGSHRLPIKCLTRPAIESSLVALFVTLQKCPGPSLKRDLDWADGAGWFAAWMTKYGAHSQRPYALAALFPTIRTLSIFCRARARKPRSLGRSRPPSLPHTTCGDLACHANYAKQASAATVRPLQLFSVPRSAFN